MHITSRIQLVTAIALTGLLAHHLTAQQSAPQSNPAHDNRADEPALHIHCSQRDYVVHPESGAIEPAPHSSQRGVRSPDGKWWIVRKETLEHGYQLHLAADNAGDPAVESKLLFPGGNPRTVHWLPDSRRIIYGRIAPHDTRICLLDVTQSPPTEERLSGETEMTRGPTVANNGTIAWIELRERDGKLTLWDLIVRDSNGKSEAVVERKFIASPVISPDGSHIAWSSINELSLTNLQTKKTTTVPLKDLDEKLWNHHAIDLAWNHDGSSIAGCFSFAGGRSAGFNETEMPVLFGDREVFIIPVQDGSPKSEAAKLHSLSSDVISLTWATPDA